jgi:hypothetical protein
MPNAWVTDAHLVGQCTDHLPAGLVVDPAALTAAG